MYQAPPEDPQASRPSLFVWLWDFAFLLMPLSIVLSLVLLVAMAPDLVLAPPFDWLPLLGSFVFTLLAAGSYAHQRPAGGKHLASLWLYVFVLAVGLMMLVYNYRARLRAACRLLLGGSFILAGVNHFVQRDFYLSIMPPFLPWHWPLVALSGVAEIVLGALLPLRRLRQPASWGLVALLLAVFPANVHMAINSELYRPIPAWLLWARLPLQGLLIWLVRWSAGREGGQRMTH